MAASRHAKIIVRVLREHLPALDSEVVSARTRSPSKRVTRATVVEDMVERRLVIQSRPEGPALHRTLLAESAAMREAALSARAAGDSGAARRAGLIAAAMELKALAALEEPSEKAVQSSLITALCLLREAVEYAHLPVIPGSRRVRT